jgi:hypothetical protein
MSDDDLIAQFEKHGEDNVRDLVGQYPVPVAAKARRWLKERREEAKLREDALRLEQKVLAEKTFRWSKVAAIGACVGIVVAVLAWLLPRG